MNRSLYSLDANCRRRSHRLPWNIYAPQVKMLERACEFRALTSIHSHKLSQFRVGVEL